MRYLASVGAGVTLLLNAAEPELTQQDLPRVPPTELTNALSTFQIKKGFHLEVAAAEPLVVDPIALSFDEDGRMFVVEMRDYSEMRDVKPHLGRIRMMEDTDNDGVYDRATVYADDLPWPTGIICYGGGIYVAASPDILFLQDTNGDGMADVRKTIFTGFGAGKGDKLNVQALLNGFCWGLDNRVHGQTSGNGGTVVRSDRADVAPLELQGRDFSFDPRSFQLQTEGGGGQYGMCYDNHGRKYVCSNSHHIQTFMYEARYAERNQLYHLPAALVDIPVDGPAAEVYRISPEESWRVIRTKWRVTGVVPGLIEGGGRASGYFTSASGITILRGNAWPPEALGDALIADCGSNLVHRKKIRQEGVLPVAERPTDEQKVEFLASRDVWFRPVQMANAPDGTLYICDMYREVIEHPWSLPAAIKKFLDLNAGNDRGRIYRVVPDGFKRPVPPRLGKASTRELVATLAHPNGWHRDTAARLLYERQDKTAVPELAKMLQSSQSPLGRLHALYALDGLGALTQENVLTALDDPDAFVRSHGTRLSENFFREGRPTPRLLNRLCALAEDPDIGVRYQLAFTLGDVRGPDKVAPLVRIARQDVDTSWTQAAILSSLAEGAGAVFAALSSDEKFGLQPSGQKFLRQLLALISAKNDSAEIAHASDFIGRIPPGAFAFEMVCALAEGLQRTRTSLASVGGSVTNVLGAASRVAADETSPESTRIPAVQVLGFTSYGASGSELLSLLEIKQPPEIQVAALSALGRFTDPQIAVEIIRQWPLLSPRLRADAIGLLVARSDRAMALLEAVQHGTIRASTIDTTQSRFLRNHANSAVRELAGKVLVSTNSSTRQQVIDSYQPALELRGDAAKGHKTYQERCISCHRIGAEGHAVGPDLVTVKNAGREKNLVNIIDPNREVRPEYVSYVVETMDDESHLGILANENGNALTVRQPFGKEDVIPRSAIRKTQSQGQSLMPDGLEAGLTPQDFADLLEFIEQAK